MRKKVQEKKPAKPAVAEKIETVDSASRVVLVLRHAKAQPKSGKPDFNRRLTKQGREDAVLVGKKIAREFGRVDFVLTSAAPRALATATAAAAAAGIPRDKIRSYKLLYAAAADKWVARMRPPARRRQNGFARRPQPRMRRPHRAARRSESRDEKIRPRRFALRRSLERNRPRFVPLAQSFPGR